MKLPEKILKVCTSQQFWNYIFFAELLAKIAEETNLYSSQTNPNKPINCTVQGTEKFLGICIIISLTPPSNVHDLCIDMLGRDLVKETVQKDVWENSYLPTFEQQEQLNSKGPNCDKLHKVRTAMDCLSKKLCQIRSVTDLPQANRFM